MKNILLACPPAQFDPALRRCLVHLVGSCQIDIAHNGYQVLEALNLKAFDLIIIDFTIPDIDSLELAESVQYIDPGVPVIVIIPQVHQIISDTVLQLKAYPIMRPFKPLNFLRLVDQLLHQYLNRYRHLAQTLADNLDKLRVHLHAAASFLVDDSGQVLTSAGTLPEPVLETMAQALVQWHQNSEAAQSSSENLLAHPSAEPVAGVHYATITESLYVAVMAPLSSPSPPSANQIWSLLKQVAADIRKAFKLYTGVT
ncbi:MAG: response regulator, partial [Anaerolineae bacterium]